MTEPARQQQCDLTLIKGESDKQLFDIRTSVIESLEVLFKTGGVGRQTTGRWEASAVQMDDKRYVIIVNGVNGDNSRGS